MSTTQSRHRSGATGGRRRALLASLRTTGDDGAGSWGAEFLETADPGDLAQLVTDLETSVIIAAMRAARRERVLLALERLDGKRCGACVDCDTPIPAERLRVLPESIRCVECQQLQDRRAGLSAWGHG